MAPKVESTSPSAGKNQSSLEFLDAGVPIFDYEELGSGEITISNKKRGFRMDTFDAGLTNYDQWFVLPDPVHGVPVKESGVFVEAPKPDNLHESNDPGYQNELKAGRLISQIDFVREVKQVSANDSLDKKMIDLVVTMVDGYPIDQVFVQVKSSNIAVQYFFDSIGIQLDIEDMQNGIGRDKSNGDVEYRARRDWMKRNRFIVINAGSKKTGPVTGEYVQGKFLRDLEEIVAFETGQQAMQPAA
jgi:hypothetical protein